MGDDLLRSSPSLSSCCCTVLCTSLTSLSQRATVVPRAARATWFQYMQADGGGEMYLDIRRCYTLRRSERVNRERNSNFESALFFFLLSHLWSWKGELSMLCVRLMYFVRHTQRRGL